MLQEQLVFCDPLCSSLRSSSLRIKSYINNTYIPLRCHFLVAARGFRARFRALPSCSWECETETAPPPLARPTSEKGPMRREACRTNSGKSSRSGWEKNEGLVRGEKEKDERATEDDAGLGNSICGGGGGGGG